MNKQKKSVNVWWLVVLFYFILFVCVAYYYGRIVGSSERFDEIVEKTYDCEPVTLTDSEGYKIGMLINYECTQKEHYFLEEVPQQPNFSFKLWRAFNGNHS